MLQVITSFFKKCVQNFNFWVLLCLMISLAFVVTFKFLDKTEGHNQKYNTIVSDGKGYYAYLPALFIYNDLNFGFNQTVEKYNHPETWYTDYRYKLDKKRIFTKYYVGTAIAYSPFFLIAHGLSLGMGWNADGYTAIYHGAVLIASLCYMVITLLFMGKILDYFNIRYWVKVVCILGVYFGTNWFYYTTWEASLSHVYSAGIMAAFLYHFTLFIQKTHFRNGLIFGALLGFIILLRPVNALIVFFLPLFFPSKKSLLNWIVQVFSNKSLILCISVATLCVISIQLIIYKIQLDQWFIYAYLDEGFNFLSTNIVPFMLSFKKGFLVYTPIFLFSIWGVFFWFRQNRFQAICWTCAMLIVIYVLSSWHMWWYGGTFGTRVLIEYYLLWVIPLALFFQRLKFNHRNFFVGLFFMLVFNGVLQQYQYRKGIIHYEAMTWQLYKDAFLYPLIP